MHFICMSKVQLIISPRERDLGGFSVRRILPYATHRMVGPFIFFDHMGPANFAPRAGMDVRPHPHIGLATVTYLFEGQIRHRDSLGSDQLIEPGAVNWMTAGRGVVHSERTPEGARATGSRMNGIQLWVALPEEHEEIEPSFVHHPRPTLPEFKIGNVEIKLLLGSVFDQKSPVVTHSDLFYLEARIPKGSHFRLPIEGKEAAVYVVEGLVTIGAQQIGLNTMAVAEKGEDIVIEGTEASRVMILGGGPVGERHIYWNFVSSSLEKIEKAKKDWALGPREDSERFKPIPNDHQEFIPLPTEKGNPKGTIM